MSAALEALYEERERILDDLEQARLSIHDADTLWAYQQSVAAHSALEQDFQANARRILELGGEVE